MSDEVGIFLLFTAVCVFWTLLISMGALSRLREIRAEQEALRAEREQLDAAHSCPWCGALVPEDDDCPRPTYHCHHAIVLKRRSS